MHKNLNIIIRNFLAIILLPILFSACEDDQIEISAKDHHELAKLYLQQGEFKSSLIEGKNALKLKPNDTGVLTTMARVLLKLSDNDNATTLIKKALSFDKDNQELQLLLVQSYLVQNKIRSATKVFEDIDQSTIQNRSKYLTLKADLFMAEGKLNKSRLLYLEAHKTDKQYVKAILGIAKVALALKDMNAVEKYTKLAIKTAPSSIDALLWQAQVYILQDKHRDAETILSRAMIELERYDTLTADKFAAINMLAKTLVAQGKIEESYTYSNYLAKSRPGKIQTSYNNAIQLFNKNLNIDEIEKAFQDVLDQAPKHKPSGTIIGLINFQKGNYNEADEYLNKYSSDENSALRAKKVHALTKIKLNKINEAIKLLTETISLHKNDSDLHALLGLAYLRDNNIENSIQFHKKAIALNSKESIYHTNLSKTYLQAKSYSKAIKSANDALKITPSSEQAKLTLIGAHIANNSSGKARQIIASWLKKSPNNTFALNALATLELESGNTAKAKQNFLKVLQTDPDNATANLSIARLDISNKDFNTAQKRVLTVINQQPYNIKALSLLLKLTKNSETLNTSISALNATLSKHPTSTDVRLALAQLYVNSNQLNLAFKTINEIFEIDNKNTQAYLLKAKLYLAKNNITEAKKVYILLSTLKPNLAISYAELARLFILEKNYPEAIKNAKKSVSMEPNLILAHIVLATAYSKTNNKSSALKVITYLKQKANNSYIPYELEADIYTNENNFKKALEHLNHAWSKQQNIQLANKLMYTYSKLNKKQESLNAWHELASKNSDNIKIQLSYSLALYRQSSLLQAQLVLEEQLRKYPNDALILNNLANFYHESNDKRALRTALKALSISPNNPAIQDTVGWIYVTQSNNFEKGIPLIEKAYKATKNEQIKQHLSRAKKIQENNLGTSTTK